MEESPPERVNPSKDFMNPNPQLSRNMNFILTAGLAFFYTHLACDQWSLLLAFAAACYVACCIFIIRANYQ